MAKTPPRDRFAIITAWQIEGGVVSDGALRTFAVLCGFADKDGKCFATNKTLAQRRGKKDTRGIQKHLDQLESAGWIIRNHRRGRATEFVIVRRADVSKSACLSNARKIQQRKDAFGHHGRKGAAVKQAKKFARQQNSSPPGDVEFTPTGVNEVPSITLPSTNLLNTGPRRRSADELQRLNAAHYSIRDQIGPDNYLTAVLNVDSSVWNELNELEYRQPTAGARRLLEMLKALASRPDPGALVGGP